MKHLSSLTLAELGNTVCVVCDINPMDEYACQAAFSDNEAICLDCCGCPDHTPDLLGQITFRASEVIPCGECKRPMLPNVSTWHTCSDDCDDNCDDAGCGWTCANVACPEYAADQIDAADLVAVGVPVWVAVIFERLAQQLRPVADDCNHLYKDCCYSQGVNAGHLEALQYAESLGIHVGLLHDYDGSSATTCTECN